MLIGSNEWFADYWQEIVEETSDHIKFIGEENKVFQGLRERYSGDVEVVMLVREMLFENAKLMGLLQERVSNARSKIKAIPKIEKPG